MTINPTSVFQYLRGALRGAYGHESLQDKAVLIIGLEHYEDQELIRLFYGRSEKLYFAATEHHMAAYCLAVSLCPTLARWDGEEVDVTLNLETKLLKMRGKLGLLETIGEDPYTQGIHDFYI